MSSVAGSGTKTGAPPGLATPGEFGASLSALQDDPNFGLVITDGTPGHSLDLDVMYVLPDGTTSSQPGSTTSAAAAARARSDKAATSPTNGRSTSRSRGASREGRRTRRTPREHRTPRSRKSSASSFLRMSGLPNVDDDDADMAEADGKPADPYVFSKDAWPLSSQPKVDTGGGGGGRNAHTPVKYRPPGIAGIGAMRPGSAGGVSPLLTPRMAPGSAASTPTSLSAALFRTQENNFATSLDSYARIATPEASDSRNSNERSRGSRRPQSQMSVATHFSRLSPEDKARRQSLKRNTMDRENTFFSSTPLLPPFVSSCNRTVDLDHRYHITTDAVIDEYLGEWAKRPLTAPGQITWADTLSATGSPRPITRSSVRSEWTTRSTAKQPKPRDYSKLSFLEKGWIRPMTHEIPDRVVLGFKNRATLAARKDPRHVPGVFCATKSRGVRRVQKVLLSSASKKALAKKRAKAKQHGAGGAGGGGGNGGGAPGFAGAGDSPKRRPVWNRKPDIPVRYSSVRVRPRYRFSSTKPVKSPMAVRSRRKSAPAPTPET